MAKTGRDDLQDRSDEEGQHQLQLRSESLPGRMVIVSEVGDKSRGQVQDGKVGEEVADQLLVPGRRVPLKLVNVPDLGLDSLQDVRGRRFFLQKSQSSFDLCMYVCKK